MHNIHVYIVFNLNKHRLNNNSNIIKIVIIHI